MSLPASDHRRRALAGCLLGQALGDSLGLPCENLSPRRLARLFPPPLRHRFLFGRGMVSDDTEHAVLTALACRDSGGEPAAFGLALAGYLRWWVAALPAGVGWATLRALGKLWLGWSPATAGVVSAGNGPAMRATVLGVVAGDDPARLAELVRVSTRLTHTDPRAEAGALVIALAARQAMRQGGGRPDPAAFVDEVAAALAGHPAGPTLLEALRQAAAAGASLPPPAPGGPQVPASGPAVSPASFSGSGEFPVAPNATREADSPAATVAAFAADLGSPHGVSGYILHTVPAVCLCWFRWGDDPRTALSAMIGAGGDADTTGAILGGILGAGVGPAGFPADWVAGLADWPCSPAYLEEVAASVAGEPGATTVQWPWWGARLARNLFFLAVVLAHGFRRLLPPY
ncbi:MAG: ADP-ribosylglycohydrolase [Candidatus Riflebacteria bacterium]|nr:ADP-ribosylglycohydrolase [Candidatus Riflebacteria bacterium]